MVLQNMFRFLLYLQSLCCIHHIYCIMHTPIYNIYASYLLYHPYPYIIYMHHIYCIMHTPIYNIYASYLLYHIPLSVYIISNVSHTPICMHHIYCITYPYLYVSYLLYHILLSACIISTNKITFQR